MPVTLQLFNESTYFKAQLKNIVCDLVSSKIITYKVLNLNKWWADHGANKVKKVPIFGFWYGLSNSQKVFFCFEIVTN